MPDLRKLFLRCFCEKHLQVSLHHMTEDSHSSFLTMIIGSQLTIFNGFFSFTLDGEKAVEGLIYSPEKKL